MNEYSYNYQKQSGKVMADTLAEARCKAQQLMGLSNYCNEGIAVRLVKLNGVPYSFKKAITP